MTGQLVLGRRRMLAAFFSCRMQTSPAQAGGTGAAPAARSAAVHAVPILVYHRVAERAVDSMTVSQPRLEAQLALLQRIGCRIVPLADVVAWRRGQGTLPPRAVALCADDGHRSQHDRLVPALRERGWPMTFFVYPSAISNAPYAMTWAQLRALADDDACSVQSHTWWHPNFLRDRERLSPAAFEAELDQQLRHPKALLERQLGRPVTLLAWPFGIADETLAARAAACGYEAGFVLGNRAATLQDPRWLLPRHLLVDSVDERQLGQRLEAAFDRRLEPASGREGAR